MYPFAIIAQEMPKGSHQFYVNGEALELSRRIAGVLISSGFNIEASTPTALSARRGSTIKTRLLGTMLASATDLPIELKIETKQTGQNVLVNAEYRDRLGPGIKIGTGGSTRPFLMTSSGLYRVNLAWLQPAPHHFARIVGPR